MVENTQGFYQMHGTQNGRETKIQYLDPLEVLSKILHSSLLKIEKLVLLLKGQIHFFATFTINYNEPIIIDKYNLFLQLTAYY